MSDGHCTGWFDGDWLDCCLAHDAAYDSGTVTVWTHVDLGVCVAHTSGGPLMGLVMAIATLVWWIGKRLIGKK